MQTMAMEERVYRLDSCASSIKSRVQPFQYCLEISVMFGLVENQLISWKEMETKVMET